MKNKKIIILITAITFVIISIFIGWILGNRNRTYKVIFYNDETVYKQEEIKKSKMVNRPTDPQKEGYIFIEWQLNGKIYDFSAPVNENLVLKAKWQEKNDNIETITIIWNSDGGTTYPNQIIEKGTKITKPADPTKTGYIFQYWSINGEKIDYDKILEEDTTIKAIWTKVNVQASKSSSTTNNESNSSNSQPNNHSNNEEEYIESYTIIFSSNGGTIVPVQYVKKGEKIIKPEDPTRDGYEFVAWREDINGSDYDFNTKIYKNTVLNAVWKYIEREKHTVSFVTGKENYNIPPVQVEDGGIIVEPAEMTQDDHIFVEWQLEGQKYNFNTPITRDITLIAKWKYKNYDITIDGLCRYDYATVDYNQSMLQLYGQSTGDKNYCEGKEIYTFKGKTPGQTRVIIKKYHINEIMGFEEHLAGVYEYEFNIDNDLIVTGGPA